MGLLRNLTAVFVLRKQDQFPSESIFFHMGLKGKHSIRLFFIHLFGTPCVSTNKAKFIVKQEGISVDGQPPACQNGQVWIDMERGPQVNKLKQVGGTARVRGSPCGTRGLGLGWWFSRWTSLEQGRVNTFKQIHVWTDRITDRHD